MSPLTTLDLTEHEESSGPIVVDPRLKERNKILKVTMTLVGLVAGVAPFVNYVALELPILGTQEATLIDSFSAATKATPVESSPVVEADFLNVRKGPGVQHPTMGQILKGTKVTALAEQGGWLKILTNQGEGWIDGRYITSPLDSANVSNLRDFLWKAGKDPKVVTRFQGLPPYTPWLPAVALVVLGCVLAYIPFARTRRELAALRCGVLVCTALSAYALMFHLLLAQTFRQTVAELSSTAAGNLSQAGLIGSLAGVAALAFAGNFRMQIGPALYILAASGALMSALSLFLIPLERAKRVRPYRDPSEPMRYLDL